MLQHAAQRLTLTDDLFKVQLASDFVLEVDLLLRQFVLEMRNFSERHGVFDRDGHLSRDLSKKRKVIRHKGALAVRS